MNFIKNIISKIARKANETITTVAEKTETVMNNSRGDGYTSDALRILISVVIGALLLAGLYALFNSTIMPTVTAKVQELFNYAG